jgi:hypothetical protein
MLERTSRFVLEVLPYLLSVLIAAIVVPGFLYSHALGTKAAATPSVAGGDVEIIEEHTALVPGQMPSDRPAKMAGDRLPIAKLGAQYVVTE